MLVIDRFTKRCSAKRVLMAGAYVSTSHEGEGWVQTDRKSAALEVAQGRLVDLSTVLWGEVSTISQFVSERGLITP